MGIIEANKIIYEYKKYGEDGQVESTHKAVDGVDLDIKRGDFVAILGHNGSGKSTLAKHINAILVPTEGPSMWMGRSPAGRRISGMCARAQGWCFRIRTTRLSVLWWRRM